MLFKSPLELALLTGIVLGTIGCGNSSYFSEAVSTTPAPPETASDDALAADKAAVGNATVGNVEDVANRSAAVDTGGQSLEPINLLLSSCDSPLPELDVKAVTTDTACSPGSAIVSINDGYAPEIVCCPLMDKAALPATANAAFASDDGSCGTDSVTRAARIAADDLFTGEFSCIQLSSGYKLGNPVTAIFARADDATLKADVRAIASKLNVNDGCICPAGTVHIGSVHSAADKDAEVDGRANDHCYDRCAPIFRIAP